MIYEEVKNFYLKYRGKKCVIGYSFKGRAIFAMHVGSFTGRQFMAAYAFHGREWITARLALRHIRTGVARGRGCWVVPLVNPDGAVISQTVSPLWKANARGVDLNCNFDALWGTGRLNTRTRGAENCIGDFPFSEPESKALADFTLKVMPNAALAFHTKGEEIYWEFDGAGFIMGARVLARSTGYTPRIITGSAGGYKDWCLKRLKIPAYTIECGSDILAHPITQLRCLKKCYRILYDFTLQYG